jgi:hypothetical protein
LHIIPARNKECKKENRIPQPKFSFHGNQIKYILKGIVNLFSEIKGKLRSQYEPEAFHLDLLCTILISIPIPTPIIIQIS